MHQFQSTTFTGDRPPQLVIGNSGVATSTPEPNGSFSATVDGKEAKGLAFADHGFLDIPSLDPATGAWSGAIMSPDGAIVATCESTAPTGSICTSTAATPNESPSDSPSDS